MLTRCPASFLLAVLRMWHFHSTPSSELVHDQVHGTNDVSTGLMTMERYLMEETDGSLGSACRGAYGLKRMLEDFLEDFFFLLFFFVVVIIVTVVVAGVFIM